MTSFSELGLIEPLLRAIDEQGYRTPSPVQAQAIPAVLAGRDVMAAAQTGTGKTAAFTLPMLHKMSTGQPTSGNRVRALILTPTRELAAQIGENVVDYSKYLRVRSTVVFGGVSINPQMLALRKGVDVLVACPGRLLDLYQQNAVRFDELEYLVLDEADRMLDMGFIHDIKKILRLLPAKRQNLLFSATFSPEIRELAKGLVNAPLEIDVSPRNSTAHTVTQWVVPADKKQKPAILHRLLSKNNWQQVLVFTRTKHGANRLAEFLNEQNIRAAAIHGNKSQGARTRALADFKKGDLTVLVATDIAARGLDIEQLPYVVNFELPNVAADYVHRIGRTGRAGASGEAVSIVCAEEAEDLQGIEDLINRNLERRELMGYEPRQDVPPSRPPKAPKKPKKPKAPKLEYSADANKSSANKPTGNKPAGRTFAKPAGAGRKPAANAGAKSGSRTGAGATENSKTGSKSGSRNTSNNRPAVKSDKPARKKIWER